MEDLFRLALVFDDGHGIHSIKSGLVEYKEESIFPENYSGYGHYISKRICYWQDSFHAIELGNKLDAALSKNDVIQAASYLSSDLHFNLAGITDPAQRKQLCSLIAESLSADAE